LTLGLVSPVSNHAESPFLPAVESITFGEILLLADLALLIAEPSPSIPSNNQTEESRLGFGFLAAFNALEAVPQMLPSLDGVRGIRCSLSCLSLSASSGSLLTPRKGGSEDGYKLDGQRTAVFRLLFAMSRCFPVSYQASHQVPSDGTMGLYSEAV
jgi:hypothetical protein